MTEYLRLLNTIRGGNDGLPPRRKKINIMIEIETGVRMLTWRGHFVCLLSKDGSTIYYYF